MFETMVIVLIMIIIIIIKEEANQGEREKKKKKAETALNRLGVNPGILAPFFSNRLIRSTTTLLGCQLNRY